MNREVLNSIVVFGEERGGPLTGLVAELTAAANQALGAVAPSVSATVKTVVRVGEPINEVLKEVAESEIDLVILGKPRRHGLWRSVLPTVEGRIARRVPCATLVTA